MLHMKLMGIHNKETTMCILYTYVHMCKRKICAYRLHMHSSLLSELHCSSELLSKGYFLNKNKKQKKAKTENKKINDSLVPLFCLCNTASRRQNK